MTFNPSPLNRKVADDDWAKENLIGVIVSIREIETNNITHAFIPADMIFKIISKSPSVGKKDKFGNYHSPHDNWVDQMFRAKAIKQVLSKFPIDLSEASQLNEAMQIVNSTETVAQSQAKAESETYSDERLDANFPQWVKAVQEGKKPAMAIITHLTNGWKLTQDQTAKVYQLMDFEPIQGEVVEAEAANA